MPCEDLVDGASPPHLKFVPADTRSNDMGCTLPQREPEVCPLPHKCGITWYFAGSPVVLQRKHKAKRPVKLMATLVPVHAVMKSISTYTMAAVGAGYASGYECGGPPQRGRFNRALVHLPSTW